MLLQEQGLESARGSRWEALSGLLPDVSARVGEARRVVSLAEFGFTEFPGLTARTVGPFNVFDARVMVSQPVLDISALNGGARRSCPRHRGEARREECARAGGAGRRQPVSECGVHRDAGRDGAGRAPDRRRALRAHQRISRRAGIAAGIDVLRTQVQQQTERQRLVAAENDAAKARLQLARAVGLPPGQDVRLTDAIPYAPMQQVTLEDALARAYATRPDYLAAQALLEAAEATDRAARTSLLPSLHVNGEAGRVGLTPSDTDFVYGMSARRCASRCSIAAASRPGSPPPPPICSAAARCWPTCAAASTSTSGRRFWICTPPSRRWRRPGRPRAGQPAVVQSRDRFSAGVAGSLEVVQSQEARRGRQ